MVILVSSLPLIFNSLFVVPKVKWDLNSLGGKDSFGWVMAPLDSQHLLLKIGVVGLMAGLIFLVTSLNLHKWEKVNEGFVGKWLVPISLAMFVLASWYSMATWAGSHSVNRSFQSRHKIYDRALSEVSLKKQIDGEIDEFLDRLDGVSGIEFREIDTISSLTPIEESRQWRIVLEQLRLEASKTVTDEQKLARLLATAGHFRKRLRSPRSESGWVVKPFRKLTDVQVSNTDEVFNWIDQRGGEKWKPYELYEVVIHDRG